jgi:uncharacterized membrane protein YphA (DoxX/SURF4 family)
MSSFRLRFEKVDERLTHWMAHHGVAVLRISLGIIFFWFGFLKFFPGASPAVELATTTMSVLSFSILTPEISIVILAVWESSIGIGLIAGRFIRITLLLLWVQMLGTITPLFLFPEEAFTMFPITPTLEGQYIIKNIVLVSAGIVIGATVRGGRIVAGKI